MKKPQFLIFILSFVCYLGLVALRGINDIPIGASAFTSIVGFTVLFAGTFFALKKVRQMNEFRILLAVWAGISILEIPLRFFVEGSSFTLPTYVYWCAGILSGYGFWKAKNILLKILIPVAGIAAMAFAPSLFGYWTHHCFFGTFTGQAEQKIDAPVKFQTFQGGDTLLSDMKGQYVVLDFWYSRCGVCFMEFPGVQELYNEYKENPSLALYTVHCRLKDETCRTGTELLQEKGYDFPCLSMDIDDPNQTTQFAVFKYPTVIVLNPEGTIVFRGRLEFAKRYLDRLHL